MGPDAIMSTYDAKHVKILTYLSGLLHDMSACRKTKSKSHETIIIPG
jgi:hypothetical protein